MCLKLWICCTFVKFLLQKCKAWCHPVIHKAAFAEKFLHRFFSTAGNPAAPTTQDTTVPETDVPPRIKFKRLDKTARHIMQILDKEAVEEVRRQREIPDIKPGYIIQLKLVCETRKFLRINDVLLQ